MTPDIPELRAALEAHARAEPERGAVVARMLELLSRARGAFSRDHLAPGHFTASAFVLCPAQRQLLLVHHAKLALWVQPGGHVEPEDETLLAAARREVREETGLDELTALQPGIFDVDIHAIPASATHGAHAHFDVRYAFVAESSAIVASEEVRGARWVPLSAVLDLNPEESLARCVRRLSARRG